MKKSIQKMLAIITILSMVLPFIPVNSMAYSKLAVGETTRDIARVKQYFPSIAAQAEELKKLHPSWEFEFVNTGQDFDEMAKAQFGKGRGKNNTLSPINLIESYGGKNYSKEWIDEDRKYLGFDSDRENLRWQAPSLEAVRYLLDPRVYMNETNIFSFLALNSDVSKYNEDKAKQLIENVLKGTKNADRVNEVYEVAKELNMDYLELATKLRQEGGLLPYYGIEAYNPLNIGATGNGDEEVIKNGLNYAKNNGWTTFKKGLLGGAKIIKKYYLDNNQDTKYTMKFNVVNGGIHHQYMQNIHAAINEGLLLKEAYRKVDSKLNQKYVFKIPLFYGMTKKITPPPGNDDKYNAVITIDGGVRLRKEPNLQSEKLGMLNFGQVFEAIEEVPRDKAESSHVWYKVRVGNTYGYTAYYNRANPNNKYFEIREKQEGEDGKEENNEPEKPKYKFVEEKDVTYPVYAVTTLSAPLRVRNNVSLSSSEVLGTLKNEQEIKVLKDVGNADGYKWVEIEFEGKKGYIARYPLSDASDVNFKYVYLKGLPLPKQEEKPEDKEKDEEKPKEEPKQPESPKPEQQEPNQPKPEDKAKDKEKGKEENNKPKEEEQQNPQKTENPKPESPKPENPKPETQKDELKLDEKLKELVKYDDKFMYFDWQVKEEDFFKQNPKIEIFTEGLEKAKQNIGKTDKKLLKTGDILKVNDNYYTIIKKGDINKDGKIDNKDVRKVLEIINNNELVSEIEKLAAYVQVEYDKEKLKDEKVNIICATNIVYAISELTK